MNETAKVPERLGRLIVSPKAYAKQKPLFAGFQWLRANLPLGRVQTEGFDPLWAATKHASILELSRRHDLFLNDDRAPTPLPRPPPPTPPPLTPPLPPPH